MSLENGTFATFHFLNVYFRIFFHPDGFHENGSHENGSHENRCKGVHCVDLGESFPTHILLQNLASTQPRTSPLKFARSPLTDPPGWFREQKTQGTSDETWRSLIVSEMVQGQTFFS